MQSRKRTFLGLGSNVGNRLENIVRAIDRLSRLGEVVKVSTVYESEPWGVEEQPPFLNCVLELRTPIGVRELLTEVKEIERSVGRKMRFRWGPREIDIDILLYDHEVVDEPGLSVPHPYIEERDFVLVPLLELDGSLVNPKTGKAYREHLPGLRPKLKPFCCIVGQGRPSVGALL
ncbi:2-amino-4-hydroxy-6-hydroxymethyldihydropteridine diphosphokinase [Hydrogenivirga sp.]